MNFIITVQDEYKNYGVVTVKVTEFRAHYIDKALQNLGFDVRVLCYDSGLFEPEETWTLRIMWKDKPNGYIILEEKLQEIKNLDTESRNRAPKRDTALG